MIEFKARLQLWKQNTQNVMRGRTSSTRSRSSSASSQNSGTSADSNSSDSFSAHDYERPGSHASAKQPAPSTHSAELERVAALQNKAPSRIATMKANHRGHEFKLMPAYVRSDALHTLGYAKSAKRSKEILKLLEHADVVDHTRLMTRAHFNLDSLISLSTAWPGIKPLSAKEQQGLRVYVEGMQFNLDELGKNILNLDAAQRPYALYYARFAPTPEHSRTVMNNMQAFGVLDANFNPVNGGEHFDRYKNTYERHLFARFSQDPHYETLFAQAHDQLEAIRDTLFPLPSYVAPKSSR
jgi:hypothetical protein